jgi:glycosyltransferase involved in cell wall biosynthesis
MRIGFLVVKNLPLGGGIERYTYEVGVRLVARGHKVVVFSMGHYGASASVDGIDVVKVPCLPGSTSERLSASFISVLSVLRHKSTFDIVHLHTPMTGAFGVLLKLLSVPTVVQMHGVDWRRSRWGAFASLVIRELERVVMWQMPSCTAVSQTQCNYYRKRYNRQIRFIPTATSAPTLSKDSNELEKLDLAPQRYILFTGRLVPEKGAQYLISAFRKINTDLKLVIAGGGLASGGYTRVLCRLAEGDPRILFPGFVEGELKKQLLSHAAIYVHPSELEGLSIALLDAMSYELPCLVSDIPENIEAIGDTGLTFQSCNPDDLRARLEELIVNDCKRRELGRASKLRVLEHDSWDQVTEALEQFYLEAIKAKEGKGQQASSAEDREPVALKTGL